MSCLCSQPVQHHEPPTARISSTSKELFDPLVQFGLGHVCYAPLGVASECCDILKSPMDGCSMVQSTPPRPRCISEITALVGKVVNLWVPEGLGKVLLDWFIFV